MQFNPTNYPVVTPVATDTVLLRQSTSGEVKSALVSEISGANNLVQTIAALKALSVLNIASGYLMNVAGYYATNDGGGGEFFYSASSSATDNGGTVIAPNAGIGRWLRSYSGPLDVRWFGAKGDRTTDDTAAVQAAVNFASTVGQAAANTYGGSTVYFAAGVRCRITNQIIVPGGSNGLALVAEKPDNDPTYSTLIYDGDTDLPIVSVRYYYTGQQATRLTADATLAAVAASSVTVLIDNSTFLANGASIAGYLKDVAGTLSRSGSTYTFTRSATGFSETFIGNFDIFSPDSPGSGIIIADRKFRMEGMCLYGNGNAFGVVLEGHGSGSLFENIKVSGVKTAMQISHPPAKGNDEYHTLIRCSLNATQFGLDVTNGDAFAITLLGTDVIVVPTLGDRGYYASIRVADQKTGFGAGLSAFGCNIGSANHGTGTEALNNVAMLDVYGVGDPILIDGNRAEHVGVGVRYHNEAGGTRNITIRDTHFAGMAKKLLPVFQASTSYPLNMMFSSGSNTYRVVTAGTSAASAPVTTNKSIETNGTMKVVYIAADNAQENWGTWSRIVDNTSAPTAVATETTVVAKGGNILFDSCKFAPNDIAVASPVNGLALYISGTAQVVSFRNSTFDGRQYEFNPGGCMVSRQDCSGRVFFTNYAHTWRQALGYGQQVNYLLNNANPNAGSWTIGASASVQTADLNNPGYMPVLGGQGYFLTSTSPYNVAASQIIQDTGMSATADINNSNWVFRAFAGNNVNNCALVNIVDSNGYLIGGGFYGVNAPIEIPFDTGSTPLAGTIRVQIGAFENSGAASGIAKILRPQICYRETRCAYAQTLGFPIDQNNFHYTTDDAYSASAFYAQGRLTIPSAYRGAIKTTKWGLKDGDLMLNSNRRAAMFAGDVWTEMPRTFYQSGVVAPTTGIWRVGDQILDSTPTSGSFVGQLCTVAGAFTATGGFAPVDYAIWAATTGVQDGTYRYTTGSRVYRCITPGTTSGSEPVAVSGLVQDGTVVWEFIGTITAPTFKTFGPIS